MHCNLHTDLSAYLHTGLSAALVCIQACCVKLAVAVYDNHCVRLQHIPNLCLVLFLITQLQRAAIAVTVHL